MAGPDYGFTWQAAQLRQQRNVSDRIQAEAARTQARSAAEFNAVRAGMLPAVTAAEIARANAQADQIRAGIANTNADMFDPNSATRAEAAQRFGQAGLLREQTVGQRIDNAFNSYMGAVTPGGAPVPGALSPSALPDTGAPFSTVVTAPRPAAQPMFSDSGLPRGLVPGQRVTVGGFGRPMTSYTGLPEITDTGVTTTRRPGFAKGTARVPGKGSGKVDTVPAKLAPGEAVLNKAAADAMGRGLIAKANAAGAKKMGLV